MVVKGWGQVEAVRVVNEWVVLVATVWAAKVVRILVVWDLEVLALVVCVVLVAAPVVA